MNQLITNGSPDAYAAFATAQAGFKSAIKDAANPFFKSRYADLSAIWEAVSESLAKNGLFVTQPIRITEGNGTVVETIIRYKDGTIVEFCQCPVVCKVQNDPQAMGSALTYARRYSLASILCIVTDDDDANTATGNQQASKPAATTAPVAPAPTKKELEDWAKAFQAWKGVNDSLSPTPDDYAAHTAALRSLKGVSPDEKGKQFSELLKLAERKGLIYNELKKVFYVAESAQTPA